MCENDCYIENWDFCQLFERLGARKLTILTDRKNIDHFLTFHQRMRNELQYSHIMGPPEKAQSAQSKHRVNVSYLGRFQNTEYNTE